jgi:hypothetical protein
MTTALTSDQINKLPPPVLRKHAKEILKLDPTEVGKMTPDAIKAALIAHFAPKPGKGAKKDPALTPANDDTPPASAGDKGGRKRAEPPASAASNKTRGEHPSWSDFDALAARVAMLEAGIGIANGHEVPTASWKDSYPNIAEFIAVEADGSPVVNIKAPMVDTFTEKQCHELARLMQEPTDDGAGNSLPLRILKKRLRDRITEFEKQSGAAPEPATPAAGPGKGAAKPAAPAKKEWNHGDIVKAKFGGETFDPVRVIRRNNKAGTEWLLHFAVDNTFARIPAGDIVGPSTTEWELDEAPADVAVTF